jgi:hypothetical protein
MTMVSNERMAANGRRGKERGEERGKERGKGGGIVALIFMAVAVPEVLSAHVALEVLGVHALAEEQHVLARDGLLALGADVDRRIDDDLDVLLALAAVGIAAGLLELGTGQRETAALARKVVGMVHPPQRLDDAFPDGLLAGIAARRKQLPVVLFAIGLTLVFDELAAGEGLRAVGTHKVLRMVGFVERVHHLADHHFAAVVAGRSVEVDRATVGCVCGHPRHAGPVAFRRGRPHAGTRRHQRTASHRAHHRSWRPHRASAAAGTKRCGARTE